LVKDKLGYKYHWAVADYLQRAARHIASKVDVEQAYAVGKAAVELALKGANAVMPAIVRASSRPYRWKIGTAPLADTLYTVVVNGNAYTARTGINSLLTLSGIGSSNVSVSAVGPIAGVSNVPVSAADTLDQNFDRTVDWSSVVVQGGASYSLTIGSKTFSYTAGQNDGLFTNERGHDLVGRIGPLVAAREDLLQDGRVTADEARSIQQGEHEGRSVLNPQSPEQGQRIPDKLERMVRGLRPSTGVGKLHWTLCGWGQRTESRFRAVCVMIALEPGGGCGPTSVECS
jgi:hypothetical protein